MTARTITVTAEGAVTLNFGTSAALSDIADPLLPAGPAEALQALHDDLLARGGTRLHLEMRPELGFAHLVKGAEVVATGLAPAAPFNAVMAAEEEIMAALAPPPEPDPETSLEPDAAAPNTIAETGDPAP